MTIGENNWEVYKLKKGNIITIKWDDGESDNYDEEKYDAEKKGFTYKKLLISVDKKMRNNWDQREGESKGPFSHGTKTHHGKEKGEPYFCACWFIVSFKKEINGSCNKKGEHRFHLCIACLTHNGEHTPVP